MRLRVIVDRLKLTKENLEYGYGKEFEVSVARGTEILKTTFNGNPVVEFVPETDKELAAEKANLEAQVKELTEANETLIAEKVELENRIKELETIDETPVNEGEKSENNELEKPTNKKSSKKEGEDK